MIWKWPKTRNIIQQCCFFTQFFESRKWMGVALMESFELGAHSPNRKSALRPAKATHRFARCPFLRESISPISQRAADLCRRQRNEKVEKITSFRTRCPSCRVPRRGIFAKSAASGKWLVEQGGKWVHLAGRGSSEGVSSGDSVLARSLWGFESEGGPTQRRRPDLGFTL